MRRARRSTFVQAPLAAVLSVAFVLILGAAAASADDRFGINAQKLFWSMPQSTWAAHAQLMRADGIQVVRTDAFWSNAEPRAPVAGVHSFYWSKLDAIETTLAANQIRWQPIVDYSTSWDASRHTWSGAPDLMSPPANDQYYAEYAQALVRRYGPGGSFWSAHPALAPIPVTAVEVWNEANNSAFWHPQPNAAAYASLYQATRTAIDAVSTGVAAIAGAASNPTAPFLQSMYSALGGGAGQIDAVAIHPYADKPHDMYYDVADTRLVLEQHGDNAAPIDVTEFGWPTRGIGSGYTVIPDSERAQYLTQVTQTLTSSSCGIGRIEPHSWVTAEQNSLNPEDWFGVVHPSGVRSSSESQYSATIRGLASAGATTAAPSATTCAQQLDVPLGSTLAKPSQSGSASLLSAVHL